MNVVLHRFVTLPDGTHFDLESIRGIGPVYKETEAQAQMRASLMAPSHDNMYLVSFHGSPAEWWSNAMVPRDELQRLIDTPAQLS